VAIDFIGRNTYMPRVIVVKLYRVSSTLEHEQKSYILWW